MSALWTQLIATPEPVSLPWLGGRALFGQGRTFKLVGDLPPEHGWHSFEVDGSRRIRWAGVEAWADHDALMKAPTRCGYLVGNRFLPDDAPIVLDPRRIVEQSLEVRLVEAGLGRFSRVRVARWGHTDWVYAQQEFPLGPEAAVLDAYLDRAASVTSVPHVTPALDLAFRFESWRRTDAEERRLLMELERQEAERREAERLMAEAEQLQFAEAMASVAKRRGLIERDFAGAARAALAVGDAELLDVRDARTKTEKVVQFRFRKRRFECVVERSTLRIVDSGICLVDHGTGEKGDTYFTLESLPAVIQQAIDEGRLVVFRHAD